MHEQYSTAKSVPKFLHITLTASVGTTESSKNISEPYLIHGRTAQFTFFQTAPTITASVRTRECSKNISERYLIRGRKRERAELRFIKQLLLV